MGLALVRSSNIDRSWDRVAENDRATSLRSMTIEGLGGFADQRHELSGSVLIVCGGNAYGKSRLLRALFRGDQGVAFDFSLDDREDRTSWVYLDPGLLVMRQMVSISGDAAVSERTDASGFVRMKAEVLRQLKYVLGNDYTSFETAEIDADDPDAGNLAAWGTSQDLIYAPDVVPLFRLTRNGRTYTSEEMSHGELVACTVIWALARVDELSVLFIEEPDSALSPKSSGRCFDLLATYAHERNLTIILTSHSATGLAHAPREHLALLKRTFDGATTVSPATAIELRRELEVAVEKRVLFVVEDAAGRQWLEIFLAAKFPGLSPLYEILIAHGESNVRKACSFPREVEGFGTAICGIFDGDQRGVGTAGQTHYAYLPGLVPPEVLIRQYLLDESARTDLGIDLVTARAAYMASAGDDIHDQLVRVAGELGLSVPHVRAVVWGAYEATKKGQADLRQLEQAIADLPWGDDIELGVPPTGNSLPAAAVSAMVSGGAAEREAAVPRGAPSVGRVRGVAQSLVQRFSGRPGGGDS